MPIRLLLSFCLWVSMIMPGMAAAASHHALIQQAFNQAGSGDLKSGIHTLWGVPPTSADFAKAQSKIKTWQGILNQAAAAKAAAARVAAAPARQQGPSYWVNSNSGVY